MGIGGSQRKWIHNVRGCGWGGGKNFKMWGSEKLQLRPSPTSLTGTALSSARIQYVKYDTDHQSYWKTGSILEMALIVHTVLSYLMLWRILVGIPSETGDKR